MSSSVDEKIVRLGFDNAKFESGVAQSMSSIDKLEQKLQFKGAEKGAENLQRSVNNMDFSAMAKGIEALEKRFSTMGIVGINVLNKITNSILGAAKQLESATIGQIKAGGWSRAMNLANAKFQIEGLKADWEEMQKAINYGVKDTAYGLDAAATAASSLVASGVDYKESIDGANDSLMHTSLRAISGVAAMTNSTYEDISRVFTTVAGNGRLMGDQLLQLSSRGMNAAATLAEALHTTEGKVREMVSKGQIDFETFAKAMDDAFGEHAKEANKTFTGALSNMKAALSRFGAVFATPIINKTNTLFISLTSRIDELKKKLNSVELPYTSDELHELLDDMNLGVAGFDAAAREMGKKSIDLGTDFANMWQSGIDAFSALVKAIDLSWFDKIVEKVDNVVKKVTFFFDTLKEYLDDSAEESADAINDATKSMVVSAEEAKAAKDIIEKGLYGSGSKRHAALVELFGGGKEGEQAAKNVQAYINSIAAAGWNYDKATIQIAKDNEEVSKTDQKVIDKKEKLKKVFDTTKAVAGNLWKALTNVVTAGKKVGGAIFGSFAKIFKIDFGGVSDGVVSVSEAIVKLTEKLIPSQKTIDIITKVFDGFFTVIKKATSILYNAGKAALDFFGEFKDTKLFTNMKTSFESFVTKVENSKVFGWISDKIKSVFDTSNDSDFFGNIKNKFIELSNTIDVPSFFDNVTKKIKEAFTSLGEIDLPDIFSQNSVFDAFGKFFEEIGKIFKGDSDIPTKLKQFFEQIGEALNAIKFDDLKQNATSILALLFAYRALKIIIGIGNLLDAVASIPRNIGFFFSAFTDAVRNGGKSLKYASISLVFKSFADAILEIGIVIAGLALIPEQDLYRALSVVMVIGGIMLLISKSTSGMIKTGKKFSLAIGNLIKIRAGMLGFGLLIAGIAGTIASIAATFKMISGMENFDATLANFKKLLLLICELLASAFVAILAMNIIFKLMDRELSKTIWSAASLAIVVSALSTSLIAVGAAVNILGRAYKEYGKDNMELVFEKVLEVILAISILAVFSSILMAAAGSKFSQFAGIALMITSVAVAIGAIIGAIALLALMIKTEDSKALVPVSAAIAAVLTILVTIFSGIMLICLAMKEASNFRGMATGIIAVTLMIVAIGTALKKILEVSTMNAGAYDILLAFAAIIGLFGLVIFLIIKAFNEYSMNTVGADPGDLLLTIAIAFLGISAALFILAKAVEVVAKVSDKLGKIVLAISVFMLALMALGSIFVLLNMVTDGGMTKFFDKLIEMMIGFGLGAALFGVGAVLVAYSINLLAKGLTALTPALEEFIEVVEGHVGVAIAIVVMVGLIIAALLYLVSVIKPVVEVISEALKTVLEIIKKFTEKATDKIKKSTSNMTVRTKKIVNAIILGVIGAIAAATPEMLNTIGEMIIKVLSWLGKMAYPVAEGLVEFLINVINGLADAIFINSPRIISAIRSVISALLGLVFDVLSSLIAPLLDKLPDFIKDSSVVQTLRLMFMPGGMSGQLMEDALNARTVADETAEVRKKMVNDYREISNSTEGSADSSKKSLKDWVMGIFGLGTASKDTADQVSGSMDDMSEAVKRSVMTQTAALNYLEESFGNVAGVNADAAARSLMSGVNVKQLEGQMEELAKSNSSSYNSSFVNSMSAWSSGDFDINQYMAGKGLSDTDYAALGEENGALLNTEILNQYSQPEDYKTATKTNLDAVNEAVEENEPEVKSSVKEYLVDASTATIKDGRDDFYESGKYTIRGIIDAIYDETPIVESSMAQMVSRIKKKYETDMDQHSPSRVFYKNGQYLVQGLSDGIDASTRLATDSMEDLTDAIIISFGAPLDYVGKIASGELLYDPSIRPILDPSQIQNGARSLNDIFAGQNIQLGGYTGQLAADLTELDNSNQMVVEELRQLREDMAVMTEEITNMQMVMDTGALVGQISGPIDRSLGRSMVRKGRGN